MSRARFGLGKMTTRAEDALGGARIFDIMNAPDGGAALKVIQYAGMVTFIWQAEPSILVGIALYDRAAPLTEFAPTHFFTVDGARATAQSLNQLADAVEADAAKQAQAAFAKAKGGAK